MAEANITRTARAAVTVKSLALTSVLLVQTFVTSHEGHTPLRLHLQVTSDAERLEQKHHVQSKHVSRHVSKTYPLMLTERSEATEATAAKQGHKTSQSITNWQTKLNRVQRMELWSSHLPISGSGKNDLMRRPHLRRRFSFRFHPMWNDFHMFLTAKHPYVSLQPYSPVLHVYFITVL